MTEQNKIIVDLEDTKKTEIEKWLTFKITNEKYCINAMLVKEVLKYTDITPVPHAPYFVMGLINLRGNVVTVFDSRLRLNVEENGISSESRIIIIETDDKIVGMLVDQVDEVINIDKSDVDKTQTFGEEGSTEFIQSVYQHENEILILLDTDNLLRE